jgi:lysophospholipase L1-like esterase
MVTQLRRIRRTFGLLQTLWSIAGLTLIAVLLTEASFRCVFAIKDALSARPIPDRRVIAEGYGGETWPVRHYRELESLEDRWQPYVYFRQKPFRGQTIAIDGEGLRLTWQPPPAPVGSDETRPFRILMLGGSSLWGFGARDDHTIPSLVARRLYEKGLRVEVRNHAEIGYVSTQEVIALIRELQGGYRPDVVVFYDGVNDTTSALLEGEAAVTTNERNRRAEFNIRQSPARLGASMLARLVQESASYRFAQVIGRRLSGGRGKVGGLPDLDRRNELAAEVVRRYRANLSIVEHLGRGFDFDALCYWQPVVFDKPSLDPHERSEAEELEWARGFFHQVYEAIRDSPELRGNPKFHDLSRLYSGTGGLIFIDYCHTTESANVPIARAMATEIERCLQGRPMGSRARRQ